MSEQILQALMELFAIIARPEDYTSDDGDRQTVVESYLGRILNQELVEGYLAIFNTYYTRHQSLVNTRGVKRIGPDSVKILRICDQINRELTQKQKLIVLIHLFEFAYSDRSEISKQELEFIETVSESFNINNEEFKLIQQYTTSTDSSVFSSGNMLVVSSRDKVQNHEVKYLFARHFKGEIWFLQALSTKLYFIRYLGDTELYLNGQLLQPNKVFVFNPGSSIRDHNIKPIYYSDIITLFHEEHRESKIAFEVQDIQHRFKNGTVGLRPMSFTKESGRLVGIMGASGAGKTTLLNILNGTEKPSDGAIRINGINIHTEKKSIEGIIGHVSQDDLLIEELTVFQNLYYNAKLCFSNYREEKVIATVDRMLQNLGLYEIKDVQVGTPLNKMISGGQRKRLNIALELIREPAVLFLDEPTSGLSSRDSENIMDLLKELSLKGKLVFVVIHQPSSDIFKMFDELLILDTGGYLIYDGDPIDSIVYFKSKIHYANYNESECHVCGNVNPEQIFNIVESNILDEYGKFTQKRKFSPREWYGYFRDYIKDLKPSIEIPTELPKISFKIPNRLHQFWLFAKRDILSKLANKQYLIINFLEAPVLAFILAFLVKYYDDSVSNELGYTLHNNSNLPVYIFMSVIVAIFMGLTISAEEIIKDRKILKREAFLNLSWSSYLFSKLSVLIMISALQSLIFVLVGNTIMEIKGMYMEYWIVLFSCWVSANVMGLVISDSFKTVVTIYILIPFLVIPQIILSGVIVQYEKLNPTISSPNKIPIYGEIITARWGYEALAVHQYKDNVYMKAFYVVNKEMSHAKYMKDYWYKEMELRLDVVEKYRDDKDYKKKVDEYISIIRNEIRKTLLEEPNRKYEYLDQLYPGKITDISIKAAMEFIWQIQQDYIDVWNAKDDEEEAIVHRLGEEKVRVLKREYHNEKLTDFVRNKGEESKIIEFKGELIQKTDPVYLDPESDFVKAHFYAPRKKVFGKFYDTFWINTIVIWFMSIILFLILYFRGLRKLLDLFEIAKKKIKPEEKE
ncbi:MAG: ATP-binding cassette domain-containing protein [Bacteroidales bacterium]|nr:ATP-binding cassette domain-containing protein [Bacteroidales bacterium]